MIHFFYVPTQEYLKKFPVTIFEESFSRYDSDVVFKLLHERLMQDINPEDSVFFYNLRYTSRKTMCDFIESRGAQIINKPRLDGKLEIAREMEALGLPAPKFRLVKSSQPAKKNIYGMNFPLIFKPVRGSSGGKGIVFCESLSDVPDSFKVDMILQEYIVEARNHIIRINTIGDEAKLSVKVFTETGSPIINAASNGITELYEPTQQEVDLALAGSGVLGVDISGVDMAQTLQGPMIIEVNAVPGFTSGAKFGIPFHDYMVDFMVKKARDHEMLTAAL